MLLKVEILYAENILARRCFYPDCHRMGPYRSSCLYDNILLPVTERLTKHVLSLPTGTSIGPVEINTICQVIRLVVNYGSKVRSRLVDKCTGNAQTS